jgi:DNA-binding response OmpR family regulator
MQQPIRILIIDPLAPSRERLVDALSHRFDAVAVESRLKALDVLQKSKGIRLVLVSSFQLEWKGKQLSRHIRKRLGADCPVIWHYGEVDGCARVSDVVATEYKQKYGIDRFLTATLAPVEIARAVGAHFHKELHETKRARETFDEPSTGWGTFDSLKQALTTDVVTPIDRLPRNPLWRDVLRARVSPRNLWTILNKDLVVRPVEVHEGMSVKELLLMRVNARNVARLVTRSYGAHASH